MKKVLEYPTLDRKQFPNLVVVGATASGKTTVAYQLARLIGFGVLDLDDWIEKKHGRRIEDIFAQDGEDTFRRMETEALTAIGGILNHIIIPGAGAVEREENLELMRRLGPTIWLATPMSEVVYRLMQRPEELEKRPMLMEAKDIPDRQQRQAYLEERLGQMEKRRVDQYRQADYAMTISFATAGTCAQFIKELLVSSEAADNV
ncbi:MAG TPA: shikimate kinase [Oligoflexus sp.]|uniref:shikimate kinase n=1 Tax=Oligoflexus sp. TaxID=1971216 RepID=UPI002D557D05|nr:shikimate kinase [Oligoflexus sp.]HYX39801.1 shikimate kinase [Oligoflexus sp.]